MNRSENQSIFLRIYLILLVLAYPAKTAFLLLSEATLSIDPNVPGWALMNKFNWVPRELAVEISIIASLYVSFTIFVLYSIHTLNYKRINVAKNKVFTFTAKRQLLFYSLSSVLFFALGQVAQGGFSTVADSIFLPAAVVTACFLNPSDRRRLKYYALAACVGLFAFSIFQSKQIMIFVMLGTIADLYRNSERVTFRSSAVMAALVLVAFLFYPYLNQFRNLLNSHNAHGAFSEIVARVEADFGALGTWEMLSLSSQQVLSRIIGADGLVAAAQLPESVGSSAQDISFAIAQEEGIGVGVGLIGQLYLLTDSLHASGALFLIVTCLAVPFALKVEAKFQKQGLSSLAIILNFKILIILVGGLRWADFAVLLTGLAWVVSFMILLNILKPSGRRKAYQIAPVKRDRHLASKS